MFGIRIVTPAVTDEHGRRLAGGRLVVGGARLPFLVDLTHWTIADYERQWREGIRRIVEGAPSSALVTAYRGPRDEPHELWALWRDDAYVYVQAWSLPPAELAVPFEPRAPYAHVAPRMPSTGYGPPIAQWRVELVPFVAGALGIRLPAALR